MCGPYINKGELKKRWDEAQRKTEGYHIHIYCENSLDVFTAFTLADELQALFPEAVTHIGQVGVVGPHSRENVEVDISPQHFGAVVAWLQQNNQGLSILVHPETGDDEKDHLRSSLWINAPVPFNPAFFAPKAPPKQAGPQAPGR